MEEGAGNQGGLEGKTKEKLTENKSDGGKRT